MNTKPQRWDVFCRVVDNFGDIGVCWRLCRQLVVEHGLAVRLWVDDLMALARLCPATNPHLAEQPLAGVIVCHWPDVFPLVDAAEVVVEAFACELPGAYVSQMQKAMQAGHPPVWINLEYLSAESWVVGCHGLPSPQAGLDKYFFFPGFVPEAGGLLREAAMQVARSAWQHADAVAFRARFLAPHPQALSISLFTYENAALQDLLTTWAAGPQPIQLFLPEGRILPQVSSWLGEAIAPGQVMRRGMLDIVGLPMLAQDDYDRLLWSCDLNFVRGEDSFVRAQWAHQPWIWHIYAQSDSAHLVKLQAFLNLFLRDAPADLAAIYAEWSHSWNTQAPLVSLWPQLLAQLPALHKHVQSWSTHLAAQTDMSTALVNFVIHKVKCQTFDSNPTRSRQD